MLHGLSTNRADLIDRCRLKVAKRHAPRATDSELEHGIGRERGLRELHGTT